MYFMSFNDKNKHSSCYVRELVWECDFWEDIVIDAHSLKLVVQLAHHLHGKQETWHILKIIDLNCLCN